MAYQKMTDLAADTVVALGQGEGKLPKIEGYYLGSRQVTTSNGPSNIHVFQTPKGNVGVWGTKKINDNLGNGTRGVMTLVEYKGKVKLQGGKTQHTYNFFTDPDNKIEVSQLASGVSDIPAEEYGNNGEEVQEEELDDDTQALIAAEQSARQAKVQALLTKNKSK